MKIRKYLKKERLKRNFTQREMSSVIGISETYYILIETGHKIPGIQVINKISYALDIPVEKVRRML